MLFCVRCVHRFEEGGENVWNLWKQWFAKEGLRSAKKYDKEDEFNPCFLVPKWIRTESRALKGLTGHWAGLSVPAGIKVMQTPTI